MPMTTTQQTDAYRFFAIAFSAAPGVEYMNQIAAAYEGGATTKQIVNEFTKKSVFTNVYPNFLTNESFASRLIDNVVGTSATDAAKTEAKADVVSALNKGATRGDVIFQVFSNLAGLTGDAKWGNVAQKMANQVATSQYYTETLLKTSTDIATLQAVLAGVDHTTSVTTAALDARLNPPPAGQTYTLTTGVDNLSGTAGNDTFSALVDTNTTTNTTLNSGDSVSGGSGTDKLAITITGGGAAATYASGVRADVETLEVTNLSSAGNTHSIDASLMSTVATLSVVGGSGGVTFSNVQGLDAVNVATSQNVTVNLASPFGTGASDTASVTLNGSAASASNTLTYNGIENFNVALTGSATGSVAAGTGTTISSTSAKSFTITGNQNGILTLTTGGAGTANDTHTINASATTGSVTINYTPTGAATKASVSLGSGSDTLNVTGAMTSSYTVSGGAGTDVLGINTAVGYDSVLGVSQGDNITGFETLRTNASISQDMRGLSKNSITGLQVYGGTGTLTQSPVISTVLIGGTGTGASITLATASNTTNDSIAVTLGESNLNTPVAANGGGAVSLSLADYEKVSIASVGAANGTVTITSAALKELTVTGDQNVTVNAGSTSTAVSKIDASGHTGTTISASASGSTAATTVTMGAQLSATVTTGTGNDTITGASGNDSISSGDGADSIVAGAGNDTVDAGTGNDIVSAGAGADSVSAGDGADSVDGGAGNDTILGGLGNDTLLGGDGNDSIDAGSGDDSIDGGAGADTITAGTGTDTILGGDGNDTIIFGSSLTTGDSVDGGANTDTVSATISASITPTILNVENLDFTGGLATGAVTSADPYGTAVNLTSSTGATNARIQLTGTTSGGVINMPSTLSTVYVADAGTMAASNALNLRWASAPTSAVVSVDTLATGTNAGVVTSGATTLTIRQATTLAYNDTAGTGRTYTSALDSTVGTISTDARTLTVDMPALTAASQTGTTNLTTGAVTANSAESITVQAGNYATVRTGAIGSTNADFTNYRVTAGDVSTATAGALTASSANAVTAHYVSAGTAGTVTVGAVDYGTATVTRADIIAGISGSVTHGAVTSGLVSTLNIDVGVNAGIALAEATVSINGTNYTTNVFGSRVTSGTISLASGTTENFSFTNTGAQGSFTLTGGSLNTSNVKFAGSSLTSFSASGYSGALNFDGSSITGASSITGTNRADTIVGGSGADTISGGVGDDSITGGAGADRLTGGSGADTFVVSAAGSSVAASTSTIASGATTGVDAADTITFGSGVDVITDFVQGTDKLDVATAATAPTSLIGVTTALTNNTTYVVYGTYVASTGVFTAAAAFNATSAKDALVVTGDGTLTAANTTGYVVLTGLSAALAAGDFI